VAIYHLTTRSIRRGAGHSSLEAAAYRTGERLTDERTGRVFDHSGKPGVEHAEIVLPAAAESAGWARDRQRLWNAAEAAEHRKDARVAREYEVSLPHELTATQRLALTRALAQDLADRHGSAVDIAVHAPTAHGDPRNHHAHLLATTRQVTEAGLGAKTPIELNSATRFEQGLGSGRAEVVAIRERWATLANEHLAEHGHDVRVDHRSLRAQGIEREPIRFQGSAYKGRERPAEAVMTTERGPEEVTGGHEVTQESDQLGRASTSLEPTTPTANADPGAGPAAGDRRHLEALEQIRREAWAAWLVARTARAADTPGRGDTSDARREAREQWLAQRQGQARTAGAAPTIALASGQEPPSQTLPDDTHAL